MTSLVFVPVSRADALALRTGADLGARQAYAPTAGLAEALAIESVAALQSEVDLLWFAPEELDGLL